MRVQSECMYQVHTFTLSREHSFTSSRSVFDLTGGGRIIVQLLSSNNVLMSKEMYLDLVLPQTTYVISEGGSSIFRFPFFPLLRSSCRPSMKKRRNSWESCWLKQRNINNIIGMINWYDECQVL